MKARPRRKKGGVRAAVWAGRAGNAARFAATAAVVAPFALVFHAHVGVGGTAVLAGVALRRAFRRGGAVRAARKSAHAPSARLKRVSRRVLASFPGRRPRVRSTAAHSFGRKGQSMLGGYAVGGPGRGTVFVTDGAEAVLNDDELAALLAHEAAHVAHYDGLWAIGALSLKGFMRDAGAAAVVVAGLGAMEFPVRLAAAAVCGSVLTLAAARWASRGMERAADATAVRAAGSDSVAAALYLITDSGAQEKRGRPYARALPAAMAAWGAAAAAHEKRWWRRARQVFGTHPGLGSRVESAYRRVR